MNSRGCAACTRMFQRCTRRLGQLHTGSGLFVRPRWARGRSWPGTVNQNLPGFISINPLAIGGGQLRQRLLPLFLPTLSRVQDADQRLPRYQHRNPQYRPDPTAAARLRPVLESDLLKTGNLNQQVEGVIESRTRLPDARRSADRHGHLQGIPGHARTYGVGNEEPTTSAASVWLPAVSLRLACVSSRSATTIGTTMAISTRVSRRVALPLTNRLPVCSATSSSAGCWTRRS